MSYKSRIFLTAAVSVASALCFASKAAPDDATFVSEQAVADLRAEIPNPHHDAGNSQIDVSQFADKIAPLAEKEGRANQHSAKIYDRDVALREAKAETTDGGSLASVAKQISNGGVVSAHLLRSAQPTPANFQALKKAGVKTIINLRDGQDDINYEKGIVEKLGMQYVSIPMSSFKPVKQAQIQSFLSIVDDPKFTPALVHCRQGEDRTGTMCAMYRMKKEGWTGPQAHKEMIAYGFHPEFVMLDQAIVDASHSTTEPLTMPTFSDMSTDIKSRIGKFYNSLNTKRFSGFKTNF